MFNLHASFRAVIAENKQHAHQETHLPTTKIVTILIPSFHGLRYGTRNLQSREGRRKNKKPAFLESRGAKASSTNK